MYALLTEHCTFCELSQRLSYLFETRFANQSIESIYLRRLRDGAFVWSSFVRAWRPSVWSSFVRCGRPCGVPSSVAAVRVEFLRPWRRPCGVPSSVASSVWSTCVLGAVRVEFLRPCGVRVIHSVRFVQILRCAHKGRTCPVWSSIVRSEFLRPYGRPSDSFSSLWAAVTLTVHINALYNERAH